MAEAVKLNRPYLRPCDELFVFSLAEIIHLQRITERLGKDQPVLSVGRSQFQTFGRLRRLMPPEQGHSLGSEDDFSCLSVLWGAEDGLRTWLHQLTKDGNGTRLEIDSRPLKPTEFCLP